MPRFLPALTASALLLASTTAFAWEWQEEHEDRIWRTDTLNWAQDILADELNLQVSHQELMTEFAPPPRELWCVEAPAPKVHDCNELNFRVRSWLRQLLELPVNMPLPPGLALMPAECQSICTQ